MTTHLSPQLHAALQIIYDAYDRVYDIASHRWEYGYYYHAPSRTSDIFGHYVRSLPDFMDRDPSMITYQEYTDASQPLVDAFNAVLPSLTSYTIIVIITPTDICSWPELLYDRIMLLFRRIEAAYPRATHRDGAPSGRRKKPLSHSKSKHTERSTYRRPQPTVRWTPYKD